MINLLTVHFFWGLFIFFYLCFMFILVMLLSCLLLQTFDNLFGKKSTCWLTRILYLRVFWDSKNTNNQQYLPFHNIWCSYLYSFRLIKLPFNTASLVYWILEYEGHLASMYQLTNLFMFGTILTSYLSSLLGLNCPGNVRMQTQNIL